MQKFWISCDNKMGQENEGNSPNDFMSIILVRGGEWESFPLQASGLTFKKYNTEPQISASTLSTK